MPESSKTSTNTTTTTTTANASSINSSSSSTSSTSCSSSSSSNNSTISNNNNNNLTQNNGSQSIPSVTEKPTHYTYLKEFRVEQCSLFLQHKCTQHRPYTCFYWHFKNQRRRRPIRKRDGTFNYNADTYCDKYDEQTGLCTNGDDCPNVHRNAGDTEKRYHLRYYKTASCIHETDTKGNCIKNGSHCAFAHGPNDLRPPVYDLRELQSPITNNEFIQERLQVLTNNLEKEKLLNEDPKWNDTNYVLINYKTEQCKRPPRLCRQGFACPSYHNARDKRRNPQLFKYRSTPCPNVKQGDDWLEPSVCDSGDNCKYCHSRTEQQFHPEIYKTSKCNDMITTGYCPRGPFCAFAHIESELKTQRTHSTSESSDYTLENYITNNNVVPSNGDFSSSSSMIITDANTNNEQSNINTDNESIITSTTATTQENNRIIQNDELITYQLDTTNKLPTTRPIGSERENILRALQSPTTQHHTSQTSPSSLLTTTSTSQQQQQQQQQRSRLSLSNNNAVLLAAAAAVANKYQTQTLFNNEQQSTNTNENFIDSALGLDESTTTTTSSNANRSFSIGSTSLPIQIPNTSSMYTQAVAHDFTSPSPLNIYLQNESRRQSVIEQTAYLNSLQKSYFDSQQQQQTSSQQQQQQQQQDAFFIDKLKTDLLKEKQNTIKLESNLNQYKQFCDKYKNDLNEWQSKYYLIEQEHLKEAQKYEQLKKKLDYLETTNSKLLAFNNNNNSLNSSSNKFISSLPIDSELNKLTIDKLQSLQLVLKNDLNKIDKIILEKTTSPNVK